MNIYCVKCKTKTASNELHRFVSKNSKPMIGGNCVKCSSRKTQLVVENKEKKGGFVFSLPALAAGAAALGSLAGGASTIANSVNQKKAADKYLAEKKRHNLAMEAKKGNGLYLKPAQARYLYQPKSGKGLYLKTFK